MAYRTLGTRILVRRAPDETTASGLILALSKKVNEGEIITTGPGTATDSGALVPLTVTVGDHIIFNAHAGAEVKLEGETFLVMKEEDVLGIMEKN